MANYIGIPCAHCGKPFQEGDDVVVCPDCGAPHHRECYREVGHCALLEHHGTGNDWKDPTIRPSKPTENRNCGHCGGVNPAQGIFCQFCGSKLDDVESEGNQAATPSNQSYARQLNQPVEYAADLVENAMPTPVGPISPEEKFDGITAREIAAYIGPHSRHYLTSFKVMKESGKKYSFSWSGFFFNFCFFFYRKMWKPAVMLAGIVALLFLPKLPYTIEITKYYISVYMDMPIPYDMALIQSLSGLMQLINLFQYALMLVIGIFGNRFYYTHVIRAIHKAKEHVPPETDQRTFIAMLQKMGGTSAAAGFGSAAAVVCLLMVISYQIALRVIA